MTDATSPPRKPWLVLLWAFGLFVLAYFVLYAYYAVAGAVTGAGFKGIASGAVETPLTICIRGAIGSVAGIPFLFLIIRLLWRRPLAWLWIDRPNRRLIWHLGLGFLCAAMVVAVPLLLGYGTITAWPSRYSASTMALLLLGALGWTCFTALLEEVVFRGMVARELAQSWGWPAATVVTGLFFALVHMLGIVAILTPGTAVLLLIGGSAVNLLFVVLYRRNRSIWSPFGFHAGWNFTLAAIAGTTMSGQSADHGLFNIEIHGGLMRTGGEFGVELSLLAVVLYLAVAIAYGWRRGIVR